MNPFNKKTHENCYAGHNYAVDVCSGKIPASKFVIGACQRYLKDIADIHHPTFFFDEDKAEKYLKRVQQFEHVKGHWRTPKIVYEPWQKWIWMNIMGFLDRRTGFRRFRVAHIEVPRGNAKSAMASQAGLYFMALDNPKGNEVSTVATKKEQARIVLDSARAMAKKNKLFLQKTGTRVLAHQIVQDKSNSFMRALSSEDSGLDGLQDILAICDELHAMKRATFEVISSGMSKRADSLILCITTAGFDMESVGYAQSTYAQKVCLGEHEDDTFFAVVYCADEKDDIFDELTWRKANPNWGISVDPTTFRAKAEKARVTPSDIPNLKVKHLNIWLSGAKAYYDVNKWDECKDETLRLEDFKGKEVRLGLDLASTRDITSIGAVFKQDDIFYIFDKSFVPKERAREVHSPTWDGAIEKGELIATEGAAINYGVIEEQAVQMSKDFRVVECAYDPWNSVQMSNNLSAKGMEMVKFPMNVSNLSEPMKKLDSLMREGKIRHNGSSLLRWCLGNVVAKIDHNENVFPRKTHEDFKIDPVIAILMALALWLQDSSEPSVYELRGLRVL